MKRGTFMTMMDARIQFLPGRIADAESRLDQSTGQLHNLVAREVELLVEELRTMRAYRSLGPPWPLEDDD